MQKKQFLTGICILVFSLLILSCNKESMNQNVSVDAESSAANADKSAPCHLTRYEYADPANNYLQIDSYEYKDGKVENWNVSWGVRLNMEYNKAGKMQKARVYDGNNILTTIQFIYDGNNRVVRELWYLGETTTLDDEIVNEYNQKGQMIRNESLNYDYVCQYTYNQTGEVKSWYITMSGLPNTLAEYTYNKAVKNPISTLSGIDYQFAYANSGFFSGQRWYSSEKITLWDDQGIPFVLYDHDPNLTTWSLGKGNLPIQSVYTDRITSTQITNSFEYLSCSDPLANRSSSLRGNNQTSNKLNGKFMKTVSGVPGRGIRLR
jgi:hypothetical protein